MEESTSTPNYMPVRDVHSGDNKGGDDDSYEDKFMSSEEPVDRDGYRPNKKLWSSVGGDREGNDGVPLAHHENLAVNRSKLLVYVSLCITAVVAGIVTYWLVTQSQTRDFEAEFLTYSKEIADSSANTAKNIFGQMNALCVIFTSYSMNSNESWPNLALPNLDQRALQTEANTGTEVLIFSPIIKPDEVKSWENYTWHRQIMFDEDVHYYGPNFGNPGPVAKEIYPIPGVPRATAGYSSSMASSPEFFVPTWEVGPLPSNLSVVNMDLHSHPLLGPVIDDTIQVRDRVVSGVIDMGFLYQYMFKNYTNDGKPRSFIVKPVFKDFYNDSAVGGLMFVTLQWSAFFEANLPQATDGLLVNINDTCGSDFTYLVNGSKAVFLGQGDLHNPKYDNLKQTTFFITDIQVVNASNPMCAYAITTYPTEAFELQYRTLEPVLYAIAVVLVFLLTSMIFFFYDWTVARRQHTVLSTAERNSKIVASMFPDTVKHRILEGAEQSRVKTGNKGFKRNMKFKSVHDLSNDTEEQPGISIFKTQPIADLFPEATVMFADIVGFTAWSSARDPVQVFTLLETIYHAYDEIAKRRRVFKVETVGDCYVAAAGLPDPRPDHALVMARFARDCLYQFETMMEHLEVMLGPETTDLGMRFGLHSGPVTAGVLRGERSRFQLFGDTMNTAARIESTGLRNRIHLSSNTAEILKASGKDHWIFLREESVFAKGKGTLTTYWLDVKGEQEAKTTSKDLPASGSENADDTDKRVESQVHTADPVSAEVSQCAKLNRLVDWNKEILAKLLKEIIALRQACGVKADANRQLQKAESFVNVNIVDEVVEVIDPPQYDLMAIEDALEDAEAIELGDSVEEQLRDYVMTIAHTYRDHAFHNFEHASHVTMSVVKLLSRIVTLHRDTSDDQSCVSQSYTYGITSDPLTQFAVVLSAIVHDMDHPGVPNVQLVKERSTTAILYKNKSIAEQNSLCLAWSLLLDPRYEELRHTIYTTNAELKRFRQLLVNCVMATDVIDKDLNALRRARWEKAFSANTHHHKHGSNEDADSRKATIVIEHLIQASDVAHLMQHWHLYRKWNLRLFEEMRQAYRDGRAETDPAKDWYTGEISFFDHYIIPLAHKLKDCGLFGVSGNEYLTYAEQNREEWEKRGESIVAEMIEEDNRKHGSPPSSHFCLEAVGSK